MEGKVKLSEEYCFQKWRKLLNEPFNLMLIEKKGRENYEYFKEFFNEPPNYYFKPNNIFSYWPLNKFNSKLSNKKIHQLRLRESKIKTNLEEFVKNPKIRIIPKLPDKNITLIIYDDGIKKGTTLNLCISELLSLNFNLDKILFSYGNWCPSMWKLKLKPIFSL